MAISGDSLKDFEFFDDETKQTFKVTLTVRDGIFFRLLQRLEGAIKRNNG